MPRPATVHDVLIASPNDVSAERETLVKVMEAWNSANSRDTRIFFQPLRWELDAIPAAGADTQSIISKQIVQRADILFGVFWTRIGTKTKKAASGTVAEIEDFVTKGKDTLIYFCNRPIPIEHDPNQLRLLKSYKKKLADSALYAEFSDVSQLYTQASRHLAGLASKIANNKGSASITSPEEGTFVGPRLTVSGTVGRLQDDYRLWLVVELESGHLYPQSRIQSEAGNWTHTVRIGVLTSGGSKGIRFLVRLVAVGPASDYEFQKYAIGESGRLDYLYIAWPSDTTILDTRTVVRGD
jgi:hypothetical protein